MALLGIVGVGVVAGVIAHLILREDGYSVFGEIMLGVLGAVVLGLIAGILVGMRQISLEVVLASALGSAAILAVVVGVTLRTKGGQTREEASALAASRRGK